MNKSKLSIILLFFLIVIANANENKIFTANIKYNDILRNILPADLKGLKIIDESDFRLEEYNKIYGRIGEKIYHDHLNNLKNENKFNTVVERDFNNNGKPDIALVCSTASRDKSFLIILEKDGKSYKFVQSIKFDRIIIFVILNNKPPSGDLYVNFLEGDYGKYFIWNGKEYIAKKEDPYGA